MMRRIHLKRAVLLAPIALIALSGCTTVAPYERGFLARSVMIDGASPKMRAFEKHMQVSKEAAQNSDTVGGGGCGCT